MVWDFLEKTTFKTDYFYMIPTYGKDDTDEAEYILYLLEEKGKYVDYIHTLLMVDNYLPAFDTKEEKKLDKQVEKQIQIILNDVK